MSVLIKGMEMPKGSCEWIGENGSLRRCKLLNGDDDCKMQEGVCADATWEEQFAGCPLVEIPTPHGRLIDADELANKTFYSVTSAPYITYKKFVDAPTVIEAEGRQRHD